MLSAALIQDMSVVLTTRKLHLCVGLECDSLRQTNRLTLAG